MAIFIGSDYNEWTLHLVNDETDVEGMDRIACGLSWSGCTVHSNKTIYMIGLDGCVLWHEIYHAMGNLKHLDC